MQIKLKEDFSFIIIGKGFLMLIQWKDENFRESIIFSLLFTYNHH